MVRAGLLAFCLVTGKLAAQTPLAGDWYGHWIRAGDSMAVTLHVKRDPATAAYAATFDAERLRVTGIPFKEIQLEACCTVTMTLQGDRTTTVFTGNLSGSKLSGRFREGDSEGSFAYTRARSERPSLSERDVTFQHGAVTLAGTLLLPVKGTRHPAVVFVHGSGGEGRWASRFLAETFARHGVATLIFDKRGVGKSTGDWRTASLDDLAGDAAAGVAYLRQQNEIDAQRIGIHGHSQGGTLAPMIAVRANAAFVIASAASGVPTDSTEIYSILNSIYPAARTAEDSAYARDYVGEIVAVAYHGQSHERLDTLAAQFRGRPWYFAPPPADASYWSFSKLFGAYRPLEWWRQVRVPVLLLYGASDQRVPAAESAARIAAALRQGNPNADVTVRIFPDADHTFRLPPGPGGWPVSAPDYVPMLLNWLAR